MRGSRGGSQCRGSDRSRLRSAWSSSSRDAGRRRPSPSTAASTPASAPPPASASASAAASASAGRGDAGTVAGRQVHRRQRQHPDLQRPAGRRAAPAARAGLGAADRRPRQRRRGRLPDDLRQGPARRVDRARTLRRLRLQPAVDGRLRRPGLPARPDRSRQQRPAAATGRTSARSSATSTRPTTARSTRSRSTATSTWSITAGPAGEGRPQAAGDVGRLPRRSPQKYNGQDLNGDGQPDYGSCIAKKKGAQSYWWIISLAAGLLQSKGTEPGRVLRHRRHEPAVRPERGHDQGPRDLQAKTDDVRPARRAQHGRRRHARPVHDRSLRPDRWTGATSAPWPRAPTPRTRPARRSRPAGSRSSTAPPASSSPATRPPARTRSTASTTPRSPRSAAGPARSTRPRPKAASRTPPTTSSRT